jgi:hypothetical protein
LHHVGGAGEQDAITVLDQGLAERCGEMRLADAGRASVMLPGVWVLRWRSSTRFILGAVKVWVFSAASNTGAKSISSSDSRMAH